MGEKSAHDALADRLYSATMGTERSTIRKFAQLVRPLLVRHAVPPEHDVHWHAAACDRGEFQVGGTCFQAIAAGVTVLELQAIIDLAIRSTTLPER